MDIHEMVVPSDMADEYGHVNYKHFPCLFEPAQDALMARRGTSFAGIEGRYGLRSFVKKLAVTYQGQVFSGQNYRITTELALGNTSLTYKQNILAYRGYDLDVVATLELVVVLVETDGRPGPIPPDLREMLT